MMFRLPPLLLIPLIALVFVGLCGLGLWQYNRYSYKQDLEAERALRIAAPPLDAAEAAGVPLDDIDYRRVTARGTWDFANALTIGSRFRFGQQGEEVVVPLLPDGGGDAILINRGWYPLSERERVRAQLAAEPVADIEGLARYAADGGGRVVAAGTWTRFDPVAMAESLPYPAVQWAVIEGELVERVPFTPPDTLPVQWYIAYDDDVAHFEYMLTWFGAAITLLVVSYLSLWRSRGSGSAAEEEPTGVS
jgi:surfeit locus 1 family protein